VTAWARLTWQATDPAALALELATRLGPGATARAEPGSARVIRLGDGDLDLVPWRRETADDDPRPAGRLVYEPLDHANLALEAVGEGVIGGAALVLAAPVLRLAGVGWATVELDRAEAELGPWLDPVTVARAATDEIPEPHLGARTRIRRSPGLPGEVLILAEPVAEGRLAASLARDGEGPCAMYLEPAEGLTAWRAAAATRGIVTSAVRPGPLGPSVLLAGAPSGPHLIVVDRPRSSSSAAPGGTIVR
jgi:hypothetical protein